MAVNKIVVTDTKDSLSEEAMNAKVEESVQNKLGELDNNE